MFVFTRQYSIMNSEEEEYKNDRDKNKEKQRKENSRVF